MTYAYVNGTCNYNTKFAPGPRGPNVTLSTYCTKLNTKCYQNSFKQITQMKLIYDCRMQKHVMGQMYHNQNALWQVVQDRYLLPNSSVFCHFDCVSMTSVSLAADNSYKHRLTFSNSITFIPRNLKAIFETTVLPQRCVLNRVGFLIAPKGQLIYLFIFKTDKSE